MAKKKESVVKAVGRFAANELLGVDDAKRAINKARKGDIKGAIKSAATGALEAGTTLSGAGLGAKLGAKAGLKAGAKVADAAAKRAGEAAAKDAAKSIKPAKYGSAGSAEKTVRTNPKANAVVTKADTSIRKNNKSVVSVSKPAKVKYTTPERTAQQRVGVQKAQDTKRSVAIEKAGQSAARASRSTSLSPKVGKSTGKATGAALGVTAVASTKKVDKQKKGK